MGPTISHILATSSEVRLDKSIESNGVLSRLKKGQILEARVDQTFSPRRARLVIQGKTVSAQTHLPLQSGQKLLLRVIEAGTHPKFKLVEKGGGDPLRALTDVLRAPDRSGPYHILSRLLQTVVESDSAPVASLGKGAIERMGRLLSAVYEPSVPPDRHTVKSLISKSGMIWENKLVSILNAQKPLPPALVQRLIEGDLKALSLLAAQSASEDQPPWLEDIRAYLDSLERLQLFNTQVSKESGRYFIPLPVLLDEPIRFGQMLIDLGKDSKTDAESKDRLLRVSLLLEMSNIGHLQVELSILKDEITGIFGVEDDTTQTLINGYLPQLVEKLNRRGFHVHEMACRTLSPRILQTVSLADRLIDDREGLLSIVI